MPTPPPQDVPTAQDRKKMLDLHEKGYSVREIARRVGWSKAAVSRNLSRMGADTDRSQTAEATAARVRKIQERRVELAEKLMEDAFDWRHRIWDEYTLVIPGPEGVEHVRLDEPPLKEQSDGQKALDSTIASIDRLLEGIGNDEADDAKAVLVNLVEGLAELVGDEDGLGELDKDHDYNIADDPDQQPVDMSGGTGGK